jgi:single-strand DNA-binding protein
MNSCILMAQIVQDPQLRFTADNLAIAEMLVEFPGNRADDPPATLKVVGWGNLAQEIQQNYHQGDRIIMEGRLAMNTVERSPGVKEKRAELTVQKIHSLGMGEVTSYASSTKTENLPIVQPTEVTASRSAPAPVNVSTKKYEPEPVPQFTPSSERTSHPVMTPESDVDDIPF